MPGLERPTFRAGMMPETRRQAFRAALAIDDKSVAQWADEHSVSYTHLQLVLTNRRDSRRLRKQVDGYIADTLVPFCTTFLAAVHDEAPAAA